jgi:hypothetical protein
MSATEPHKVTLVLERDCVSVKLICPAAVRERAQSVSALYAYFRGAEYPKGRVAALVDAVVMVAKGWPLEARGKR